MALGNIPITSTPFNGPPGYLGGAFNIGGNQANSGSNNAGGTPLNPQALADAVNGSSGMDSQGGGTTGGADAPTIEYYSAIMASGSHPSIGSVSCMLTCQLKGSICEWWFFFQPYCARCHDGNYSVYFAPVAVSNLIAT